MKDLAVENQRLRKAIADLTVDKPILQQAARGNRPARRADAPASRMSRTSCTSPSAALVERSGSSIARRSAKCHGGRNDEAALTADLIELAKRYGRYGYRKITALLRAAGWPVNDKRVKRSGGARG